MTFATIIHPQILELWSVWENQTPNKVGSVRFRWFASGFLPWRSPDWQMNGRLIRSDRGERRKHPTNKNPQTTPPHRCFAHFFGQNGDFWPSANDRYQLSATKMSWARWKFHHPFHIMKGIFIPKISLNKSGYFGLKTRYLRFWCSWLDPPHFLHVTSRPWPCTHRALKTG